MIVGLDVQYLDGASEKVDTSALSVVNCERRFGGVGVVSLFLGAAPRMEALYWLAWESLRLAGRPVGTTEAAFEEWLARLALVAVVSDDAPLPPPTPLKG